MTNHESSTGAEILADIIGAWKHNPIFHVPGEGILEIIDALSVRQPHVRLISCRHEGGMTFMADASARFGDEPGLCLAARAPGALNTCLALHTAYTDSVPLVLLIGQASSASSEREAFLNVDDFHRTFGPVSKWVASVSDAARLPEFMARAFHVALSGRRGPVVLVLPEDMLQQRLPVMPIVDRPDAVRAVPANHDMDRLQALLAKSSKPVIMLGGTGWSPKACIDIANFAKVQGLPVVTAYRRRDLIDNTHSCYVGELGIGVDQALVRRIADADLLLVVGMRLGELNTIGVGVFEGYTLMKVPDPDQTLIHFHPDVEELNRVYRADLAVQATIGEAVACLASLPPVSSDDRWKEWRESARIARDDFVKGGSCPGPINLKSIFKSLRDHLPEDAIVTSGAGGYALWLQRYFEHTRYGTQVGPKSGAMGYGLPAAIGLKLSHPDRKVVAIAGDGCFMMNGEELATAVHYQVPVVILVINNNLYGAIKLGQQRLFGRTEGVELTSPNFCEYARSFGAYAERVEATEDFVPALLRSLEAKGPALIELVTSADVIKPMP